MSRMYQLLCYDPKSSFDFDGIVDGKKIGILYNLMILDKINNDASPHKYGVCGTVCIEI